MELKIIVNLSSFKVPFQLLQNFQLKTFEPYSCFLKEYCKGNTSTKRNCIGVIKLNSIIIFLFRHKKKTRGFRYKYAYCLRNHKQY